ncbi:MAG: hypothetical protein FJ218_05195 [Ignavibacteria bacterium]|nr:hypothetical protein [Ignavibacteria bacterium]
MTQTEILTELKRLPTSECISVIETALEFVREDFQYPKKEKEIQLEEAAKMALPFYLHDKDLTAFTSLDSEDFYETK